MATIPKCLLGDVSQIFSGFAFRSHDLADEGIPVIKIANIQGKRVSPECGDRLPDKLYTEKLRRYFLRDGDTLIAMTGAGSVGKVGRMLRAEGRFLVNQRVAIVRPDPSLCDPVFVYFVLSQNHYEELLYGLGLGAGQPNVSPSQIGALEIPSPSIPVQRRLAGVLSAYDELIENNLRRIRILEEMARGLYREWFVNFRFPGNECIPRVASHLGPIPQGWEVKKLGDVLELNYGKGLKQSNRRDGVVPVFGSSGVVGYHDTFVVRGPGIIVGRKGNVGTVFWSEEDFYPIDTVYFVSSHMQLHFLFYNLKSQNFINNDAAVPGLNRNQAYSLELVVPPSELLKQFCESANSFEAHASLLRKQIENLRRTRDLLLPRLLSENLSGGDIDEISSLANEKREPTQFVVGNTASSVAPTRHDESPRTVEQPSRTCHSSLSDEILDVVAPQKRETVQPKTDGGYPVPIDRTDRSEVLAAIRQVFSDGQPRTREVAMGEVARALGYGHTGQRIQDVLHTDLLTAVRRGILDNVEDELILLARSIAGYDRDFLKQQFLASVGRSWIVRGDAIQNFCRWMGFRRTGPLIAETVRSVINGLLRESRLESNGPNLIRRTS